MANPTKKYSHFHRKIRNEAHRTFYKSRRLYGLPDQATGACVDCGATQYLYYDHRDYSDVMKVDVVCGCCNARRGPAWIPFVDVETLETTVRYRERPCAARSAA